MALNGVCFVLLAMSLPMMSSATEYIVGDESGWTIGFNYQNWAADKQFFVGDKLIFRYPVGAHNVNKVNGTAFLNCIIPPPSEALISGNDTITLAIPGRKWYICGVGDHCSLGQKLFINVATLAAPSPAPSYWKVPAKKPSLLNIKWW